jgi:hypothetical protein
MMSSTTASKVFAAVDDFHGVPFGFQVEPQSLRQVRFVFDHQDAAHVR